MDTMTTQIEKEISIEEVNRVLEVGRLLFSVLTEDEIEELRKYLNGEVVELKLGNSGVT